MMGWIEEKIGRMGWNGSTEIRKEVSLNLTMDQFWKLNGLETTALQTEVHNLIKQLLKSVL